MATVSMLETLEVATPCPARWADMEGDDRVRFCRLCEKHVYNLSAMTAREAEDLIFQKEGSLCVRLHRRRDGTVITADCPVGLARLRKRLTFLLATAAGLLFLSATFAISAVVIENRAYGHTRKDRTFAEQLAKLREDPVWQVKDWLGLNPPPPPSVQTGRTVCMGQIS